MLEPGKYREVVVAAGGSISSGLLNVSSRSLCRTITLEIPFRCRDDDDDGEQVDANIADKSSLSMVSKAKSEARVDSNFLSILYSCRNNKVSSLE